MIFEQWRTVPSLPEYEASSYGRIRRKVWVGLMPRGGTRTYGGKAWFGCWAKDQNRYIFLVKGKGTYKVARIVCEAFNGPSSPSKNICMHLDENSKNNKPENLKWGTQKQNLNAPGFIKYCHERTGIKNALN